MTVSTVKRRLHGGQACMESLVWASPVWQSLPGGMLVWQRLSAEVQGDAA